MQALSSASPAPPFAIAPASAGSRRLLQSNNGVQAQVLLDGSQETVAAAQQAIQNAVQSGQILSSLQAAGVPLPST